MKIAKNYDLIKLNTFGISVRAKFFIELNNESDLKELFESPEFKNSEKLFLGGGSNILFTKNFDGIVVLNKLKGIEIINETPENVFIKSMGGEMWHALVIFTVDRGLWGIENLSLIPGTVGATPVQNIGAYGAELKDVLENVEAYEIETGEKRIFNKKECEFGYRESIFKNKLKGKYFIASVTLKLDKKRNENINYKALQEYLEKNKIEIKNSKDISDAVSFIRKSKLPNPAIIGNAGSFFKNVFVTKEKINSLLLTYPDMPFFEENGIMKIPAGWLIEQCGWKGKRVGNVGVHERQALVLVNYGGATGEEVKNLSEQIIASVYSKFGLMLEKEVNLI
ncbi:MAG: UDP-N-acetylmuramate dehydrogenase [Candidatus Paceibacterota bacterium]|jgi:UDP-N-acetylmuramate dehydrogenase